MHRLIAMRLSPAGELGVALGWAALAVLVRWLLDAWLGQQHVYTIAFAATAAAALMAGWRAGALCAVASQVGSNVLIANPKGAFSLAGDDVAQAATFYLMAVVLLAVTHLAVRSHRALGTLVQRLRAADRATTDLLATVAHELRNPAAAMQLATARLQAGASADARDRAVAALLRQLAHLHRLVDDLTDASRIQTGKVALVLAPHRFGDLLRSACELVEPVLEQRGQTLLVREDGPGDVRVDGARIVQVLANVLHNASKYSPDGTEIRVEYGVRGHRLHVEVIDQGAGIPEEKLEWVFDSYAQVTQGSEGLGLGLSLVRKLLALHGGTIQAWNRGEEPGATFAISLPLAPPG
ncbi:MAG: HAMP domain-containing histidine kinase [Comamonadaceae bacterium]|nr:MAG: HAMP domain-containing histidine kinase [Comamonadaceae bacterium]